MRSLKCLVIQSGVGVGGQQETLIHEPALLRLLPRNYRDTGEHSMPTCLRDTPLLVAGEAQ